MSLQTILTNSENGLVTSAQALAHVGDSQMSGITATSDLTSANVRQIVADFTGASFEGTSPSSPAYAVLLKANDPNYTTDAANTVAAGTGYASIPQLIKLAGMDSKDYPGGLYTVNSDLAVSSAATVKAVGMPTQYNVTLKAAGGAVKSGAEGYVLPSAFSFAFPNDFTLNVGLLGYEVPASQAAAPPPRDAIGTVALQSPAAVGYGLSRTKTLTGKIFAIAPADGSTLPQLELWFERGIYNLGTLSGSKFPLSVTFGETTVPTAISASGTDPLPMSSLSMSFPAATSPVVASSCTNLGTATGTATDAVANLAGYFGDTSDGYSHGTANPVKLSASKTKVTNSCRVPTTLKVSKASASGTKSGKAKFGFTLRSNKAFKTFTITLPKGFSYRKFSKRDLKVTGGSVTKVAVKGSKLTVTLKAGKKSVTVRTRGGIAETKAARKARSVTLRIGANGKTVKVKIKA